VRALESYLPANRPSASFGPDRRRLLIYAALAALMTAAGAWLAAEGKTWGWLGAVFFGLCVVVFVLQMIPGAARLRLDAGGFHVRSLYSGTTIRWSEIREFRVGNVGWRRLFGPPMVGYLLREGSSFSGRALRMVRAASGIEGALPERYGFLRDDLVRLLNAWREYHAGESVVNCV